MAAGIRARHGRACSSRNGRSCNCKPSYEAWVWSNREKVKIRRTFSGAGAFNAAKGWRADVLKPAKDGRLGAPSSRTVQQAGVELVEKARAGEVLTRNGGRYKPSVLREYERLLRLHVYPELGAIRLTNLRRRDVQQLVDRLVAGGTSGTVVHNIVMPLRVICRRAIRDDEITVNPTAELDMPEGATRRERVATAAEAEKLLGGLPVAQRPLWATAFYAGLRRGELRGLQWDDVDLERGVIHVRRGWDDVEGAIEPKSKKSQRTVPIAGALRIFLLEHRARTGRRGSDLVFGRTGSEPFTPTNVRRMAIKAWARAPRVWRGDMFEQLEPIGLHECRHTFVSLMVDAGFTLERIGDYVGHGSTYMTDRYRHLLEGHEQEAADRFDEYLARRSGAHSGAHLAAVAASPHS